MVSILILDKYTGQVSDSNSKWTLLRVSLLLTRRKESNSSSLAVLKYFSEDSSVEKTRTIKGAMLGMPKSRDLYNHLLPGFSGNSNPGIF